MSDLDFKFNVGDTVDFTIQDKDEEFTFLRGGVTPTAVLPQEAKEALLECLRNVAWKNGSGKEHFDRLEAALNTRNILSISAVYTQTGTVYDTDSLDSLKADLVVTAYYDDGTTASVTGYTLSGELVKGTSTITVVFYGITTTFNVTVVHNTSVVITRTNTIMAKDADYTNNERFESRANGAVTDYYPVDNPTNILYPAGIIPTSTLTIFSNTPRPSLMTYDENKKFVSEGFVNEQNRWPQSASGTLTEFSQSWTLSGNYKYVRMTIDARYADDAYMYDKTTGKIWFAGINTPYFGMSYISEAGG